MLLIVIILFVSYIVIPLVELILVERVRTAVQIGVYVLAFVYILYTLLVGKVVV